jgi:hypothetical protein
LALSSLTDVFVAEGGAHFVFELDTADGRDLITRVDAGRGSGNPHLVTTHH